MSTLQLGTTVLGKYRIDALRAEIAGSSVYDATDTLHSRQVCVKLLAEGARVSRLSLGSDVIDIGQMAGRTCIVASEVTWSQPPPPPIPKPPQHRERPPALPRTEEIIEIDDSDLDVILEEELDELSIDVDFDLAPRPEPIEPESKPRMWPLLVAAAFMAAFGGLYIGSMQRPSLFVPPQPVPAPSAVAVAAVETAPVIEPQRSIATSPEPHDVAPAETASASAPKPPPPATKTKTKVETKPKAKVKTETDDTESDTDTSDKGDPDTL